jgi:hypothetical protein
MSELPDRDFEPMSIDDAINSLVEMLWDHYNGNPCFLDVAAVDTLLRAYEKAVRGD